MMLLMPSEVLEQGLRFVNLDRLIGKKSAEVWFRKHYGSGSLDLAEMWYDLNNTDIEEAKLDEVEKSMSGFKKFMVAHHFIWTYPKNSYQLASRMGVCECYARGEPLWKWVKKIAALKAKKIVWDRDDCPEIFALSIDVTDFQTWEKQHDTYNQDPANCSRKFNHCGVKYEIGLSIFESKIQWINGPYKGSVHDITIFRDKLKAKMPEGKIGIVDRGYQGEAGLLAVPNDKDPKPLRNFKSRARCRHEALNGRIGKFKCLYEPFRHGWDKHKIALEAVCVAVQYQMDNGAELFAV